MKLFPSNNIYLGSSSIKDAGRGVFANTDIKKGEVIESCPILFIPENEDPDIRKTELHNYYFMWGR